MADINFIRGISNLSGGLYPNHVNQKNDAAADKSFKDILNEKRESGVSFSKHANARIEERNINIDEDVTNRLCEAVSQAKDKGLKNVLVMIDNAAFIVSTMNNKVVTAVNSDELKENIFTNIDGAVIK